MKILPKLILLSFIFSFQAKAKENNFYIGVDSNRSHTKYSLAVIGPTSEEWGDFGNFSDGNKTKEISYGVGINLGYRLNFDKYNINSEIMGHKLSLDKFAVAPEIFYDHLSSSAVDPYGDPNGNDAQKAAYNHDRLIVNYRYGVKTNFIYQASKKIDIFTNIGISIVDYDIHWDSISPSKSYGNGKFAMIYGIGSSYDITDKITAKISFDHQLFNIRYVVEGASAKTKINTWKAGIAYNF